MSDTPAPAAPTPEPRCTGKLLLHGFGGPGGWSEDVCGGALPCPLHPAEARRFVWLLRKPNGRAFRPKRNSTARQVKHFAERLTGESWRALWAAGYRVERVPVRTRRPKPRLVS